MDETTYLLIFVSHLLFFVWYLLCLFPMLAFVFTVVFSTMERKTANTERTGAKMNETQQTLKASKAKSETNNSR